ncbi:hypothetical protein EDC01DRAFT_780049 [Geopyxis carbonaria]|nr:hypothetical protein EDC01DRAFT_780049 [Geopyxis carbonaria]
MKLVASILTIILSTALVAAEAEPAGYCPKAKTSWRYRATKTLVKTLTVTAPKPGPKTTTRTVTTTRDLASTTATILTTLTLTLPNEICTPLPESCTASRNPLSNADFEAGTLAPWSTSGTGSGAIVPGTFEYPQWSGDSQFRFSLNRGFSSPTASNVQVLTQEIALCAGVRYQYDVRFRTLPGQEACVGRVGVQVPEGSWGSTLGMQVIGNEMAGDYDYVATEFRVPPGITQGLFHVEWRCPSGGAEGEWILFIDGIQLSII